MTDSFIRHLACMGCGHAQDDMSTALRCERCGHYMQARYDLDRAAGAIDRDAITASHGGLWRFRRLLPVRDTAAILSLAEGGTPLLPSRQIGASLGMRNLHFKDLSRNPTGSFKDYSASTCVSKARETAVRGIVLVSGGNGSSAFAAYCGVAGIPFHAVTLPGSYDAMRVQLAVYGAIDHRAEGTSVEAGRLARRLAEEHGLIDAGVPANPYRVEGKKVIGYEIAEALGWKAPDRIVCPTAGGTGIMALYKGFTELMALGWVDRMPALDCIQAESCRPIVDAWRTGEPMKGAERPDSIAVGLLSAKPEAGPHVVDIMRRTGGAGTIVSDDEIRAAQLQLARHEGLLVEPSSAAALAGLRRLRAEGRIAVDETVVLMLTGSGLKGTELLLPHLAAVAG
ncbi:MAG: threonine synthase [Rhodobacteraceae bacterium]|jgi:threonine synthase|nr:threonine synthase [Paracoccaceae bacterium]